MNNGIQVGLTLAKPLRLLTSIILFVMAGWLGGVSAQTPTTLRSFSGPDGSNPGAGLVQGNDGNFYGTTQVGGANGYGIIFRISPSGSFSNLYSFSSSDGGQAGGLAQGIDGNFYGTTWNGGSGNSGTVFRISSSGAFTNLHTFSNGDGANPSGTLVQGGDGNFYGTTYQGGNTNLSNPHGGQGWGSIYRISPNGAFTNLYSFSFGDGGSPPDGLAAGIDGNFYGTTVYGGAHNRGNFFRISPTGTLTNLYAFKSTASGAPNGLVQGSDGNFYGTTQLGGTNNNFGTIFRIDPSGNFTNLHTFNSSDGSQPIFVLVQGSDGNFYGATVQGGTSTNCSAFFGCGTLFRISPSGSFSNLYSFGNDGSRPNNLVQGSDGNFYGTTHGDVTVSTSGTVFKLTVVLGTPPYPINQITSVRVAATNAIFTIPSIAGETYQLQYRNSLTSGIWSNVPGLSVTNSIGALMTLTNLVDTSQPQGFYRFAITP